MSSKHLNELVPKKALLASAVAVALLSTNAFAAPPTATYLINGNDSDGALDLSSQNLEVQPNDVYQIYGWYHSETINRYRSEEADVTLTGLLISSENSRFAGAVNEDRMVDTVPDNLQLRKNRLKIINSSAQVIQGAWGTSTKAHGIELTENRLLIQNTEDIREFSKTSALYAAFGNLRTQNYDGSLSASRNVLTIESTAPTAYTFVYGVSLYATNQNTVEATDNVLEFKNVTSAEVWRAVAADVNAANGRETASGNKLLLTKSTVIPLEYLAASVVYDDGTESSVVNTGNTVVLEDSTVLGRVYGGFDGGQKTGMDEGNTIEVRGINKVKSIGGFDTLKLVVDATRNAQSPVLDVEESVDFTGRTIKVEGTDSFDENASYTLLSADEITGLTQERLVFEGLWEDAEGKLVLTEDTLGVNIVDVTASNSSKTLSESLLGTVAFVNQGAEFMADEGLAALVRNARPGEWRSFGAISGGTSEYETGSHVDVDGVTLATGVSTKTGDFVFSGFVEAGWASSESHVDGTSADGDHDYYGVGAAAVWRGDSGLHAEGILRLGSASTEFDGLYDTRRANYDADAFYGSISVSGGWIVPLNETIDADFYGRYVLTYLDGDEVSLDDGQNSRLDLEDTVTHAIRVGVRLSGEAAENIDWRAGAAYEHVFDGDAEASVEGLALDEPSLSGNTFIGELGLDVKTSVDSPWAVHFTVKGYAGDRQGVTGSALATYAF